MTESMHDLLSKAEDALWMGDRRAAGILLHKILLQDFTNHYAWQLLHAMLGGGQPFDAFQQSFAQKYYPEQAFLLRQPPPPVLTAPEPPAPEPVPLTPAPLSPASELSHTAPLSPASLPSALLPDQSCSNCGAACLPQSKYCHYCGLPLAPARQTLTGTGTLLLSRPTTSLARDRAFDIWIDGKQQDQIMDNEQRLLSLPAGPHTVAIKSAGRTSSPLQVPIKPSAQVHLVCYPAEAAVRGVAPDLKVIPFRKDALPIHVPSEAEQIWRIIRTALTLLLVSAFIGWILYIVSYMVRN
jgi:hypothetical protein